MCWTLSDTEMRKRLGSAGSDLPREVVIVLNRMIRVDLIEKVMSEQRLEGGEVASQVRSGGGREKAGAKIPRERSASLFREKQESP